MPTTTSEAGALTEQHRQSQLRIRASAFHDFLLLWPLWNGDTSSFGRLVQASVPLVGTYKHLSATLAAGYYRSLREAEHAASAASVALADTANLPQLTASMYVTGQQAARDALTAGQTPEQARSATLTRVSGAVTRHVLAGGRDTILQTVQQDKAARGWARVTDGDPCAFCLTLASRGAVYKTRETADFQAHDHCGCTVMPLFDGTTLPDSAKRARTIYNAAQRAATRSGLLQPGENTPAARLNAVRRYLAAQAGQ